MTRLSFHPAALREWIDVARYYDENGPALGDGFVAAVELACSRVADFPRIGHPFVPPTRRLLLRRFPFGLVYLVRGDQIRIVAIAHLRREPGYWRDRL